uniref:RICTOR_N domain-containing protein n=1 Tax=Heterorhabditis bacteriophora TaxID=37862 RepID=A0A1I7XAW1_HETBA
MVQGGFKQHVSVMSAGYDLDGLLSSPKANLYRLDSRLQKEAAFMRENMKRRSTRKPTKSLKIVPHLDRSACEKLIFDESHNALCGDYDKKCVFLNEINDIITNTLSESLNDSGFFEILCELVLEFLACDHPAIRAMCFRLLRLCTFTERNLVFMLTTHVDIYVVRALDLRVENDMEREEAIQLIAAMMSVYETSNLKKLIESSAAQKSGKKFAFPKSIMQPVISIALKTINNPKIRENIDLNDGSKAEESDSDRLSLPCVAVFLEFCVLEPELILEMAGTDWMVRILTGTSSVSRRIAAVVGRVLVTWLDDPRLRAKANLHLVLEPFHIFYLYLCNPHRNSFQQIFAPLVEFGFFQKNLVNTEQGDKIVEAAMDNFSHSFLSILRSWSGLFACAAVGPNSTVIASSPLRLLEYLGLGTVGNANLSRIRDMIVDICCDFMDLPYASREFESWSNAIQFYGYFYLKFKNFLWTMDHAFIVNIASGFLNIWQIFF